MAITYRGTTLPYAKHRDSPRARVTKNIDYPAVDGTHVMHMGKRKRIFTITGRITDMVTGVFKKTTIEAWNDTDTGTLSVHGTNYTNVRLDPNATSYGQAYTDAVTDKICCTYTLVFEKLR